MSIRAIRPILLKRGRNRAKRPKTFTSEEAANAWAKEQGLKDYTLEDLSMPSAKKRKIRIVC
jgi:hypothetical protein